MSDNARALLLETFELLVHQLSVLEKMLYADSAYPAWVVGSPTSSFMQDYTHAREATARAIAQLEYTDLQAPRDILLCPGFVGASPATLTEVYKLNEAKLGFKAAILSLKAQGLSNKETVMESQIHAILSKRRSSTALALQQVGLGRLHLKQCYRLLPILPDTLLKIRWTWAHTRAITRITVAEAQARLLKRKETPSVQMQLQKLTHLHPNEPLAIVQELAPHLRVNVNYRGPDGVPIRKMIKGAMPLFYPCQPGETIPDFQAPVEKQLRNTKRVARADVKLSPEVFLPGIRAHRYTFVE